MSELTAIQYGVGPIGSRIVRAASKQGIKFEGATDIDPEKVGRDLGDVVGLERDLDVTISEDFDAVSASDVDVVFHSTVSSLEVAMPQLRECLRSGANVVSTCEQLTFPRYRHPDLAAELNTIASEHGVSILATGINPGFAMDFLPTVLTIPCHDVDRIEVTRVQNASTRREPLQRKVGAGLTEAEFEDKIIGEEGHVGLTESVAMIGDALDWDLDHIAESAGPVIADEALSTEYFKIDPGEVSGMEQRGIGRIGDQTFVDIEISQYVGASDPRDEVRITGDQDITMKIPGGIHGDTATPAVVVNSAERVVDSSPGLRTMIDGTI